MPTIVAGSNLESFGPSFLANQTLGEAECHSLPAELSDARRLLRSHCPSSPGVYGWFDGAGQLIYVGKSKALRIRLLTYFAKTPSDPKMERIRSQSMSLAWEPIADELLALLREQELIFRWRPDFNSQGQPNRRQPAFVCISKSAAPHAVLSRRIGSSHLSVYGPLWGTSDLAESVVALNYAFGLRDCPDKTPFEFGDQLQLFSDSRRPACLRFELGSCLGPCAALCSRHQYSDRLKSAIEFLDRGSHEVVFRLGEQMERAARRCQFERAAMLRDRRQALERLGQQLGRLYQAQRTINGVLPVSTSRGRKVWLVFRHGSLASSIPEPRSLRQAEEATELLNTIERQPLAPVSELLDVNLQLIVAGWFRKHSQRIMDLSPFAEMIRRCEQLQSRLAAKSA